MTGLGSGDNGELTFLDYTTIFSLWLGMQNFGMNLTQTDKQELQSDLNKQTTQLLTEIHTHLQSQDEKLNYIIKRLEEN